jgi:DNA-directed RNA polymerase II subunit RPB11
MPVRRPCRIAAVMDAKIMNAYSYRVAREDHTLGNLLRMCVVQRGRHQAALRRAPHTMLSLLFRAYGAACRELLRDPAVKFAGYKHPHPLENDIIVRIQTAPGLHPTQAMSGAAKRLEDEYRLILNSFGSEVAKARAQSGEL